MAFNSFEYFLLLLISLAIFALIQGKTNRIIVLLFFSYLFYAAWDFRFTAILIFSTLVDFFVGQKIFLSHSTKKAKFWLIASLISNLSLLLFFKIFFYLNSFSLGAIIYIPIGISFYTFQTLSYSIDIYRGKIIPEKSILHFSLYVSFFPQILAGPIERASNFLPQINSLKINRNDIYIGSKTILFGLFKKALIADKLALLIDPIYANPSDFDVVTLLIATVLFSFQIYCDFSGYTDMAIGSARIFGIRLSDNFNKPYLAKNLQDFWHRWHISLSTWFRDYVYISLGGNKANRAKWVVAILLVFTLSGLWHGIGLTFLAWGCLHALFYLIDSLIRKLVKNKKSLNPLKVFFTFSTVTFLWIFFRANSITDAFFIIGEIFTIQVHNIAGFSISNYLEFTGLNSYSGLLIFTLLLFFLILDIGRINDNIIKQKLNVIPRFSDLIVINLIIILMIFFGDWGGEKFIYFQF